MRLSALHFLPASLFLTLATAIQLPDSLPFLAATPYFLEDAIAEATLNDTIQEHDLLKARSGNCPKGFDSCAGLGAPQLCCASRAVCSADAVNVVACCPSGAVCTGTIAGVVTQGTVNSEGVVVVGGGAVGGATTSTYGAVATSPTTTSFQYYGTSTTAATNTNSGFIVVGASSTVATPGAGMRRAEIPAVVQAIVYVVQYLPV